MRLTLQNLMIATDGMSPVEFEAYCDHTQIQIEWLEVCLTDFNDGLYIVSLPAYNDVNVFALNGSAIDYQG